MNLKGRTRNSGFSNNSQQKDKINFNTKVCTCYNLRYGFMSFSSKKFA